MITVEHLYHSYSNDEVYAVKDASFDIPQRRGLRLSRPVGRGENQQPRAY